MGRPGNEARFGAFLASCPCLFFLLVSPTGKVQTTTSTYKYKMQVEEATAPQEPVQDLQDKQDGEEEEKKEGEVEEKKEGEGEDISDPPAEQSVSQDITDEEKQEEAEEATES